MATTLTKKITAISVISGVGFIMLVGTGFFVTRRVNHQIETVRQKYIPLIESGPKLRADFESIKRELQDAVASRDQDALHATQEMYQNFQKDLRVIETAAMAEDLREASEAIAVWYEAAYQVSRRLMAREMGVKIVGVMKAMQIKLARAEELLTRATTFDRHRLDSAFLEISKVQESDATIHLGVAAFAMAFVVVVALWVVRQVPK